METILPMLDPLPDQLIVSLSVSTNRRAILGHWPYQTTANLHGPKIIRLALWKFPFEKLMILTCRIRKGTQRDHSRPSSGSQLARFDQSKISAIDRS